MQFVSAVGDARNNWKRLFGSIGRWIDESENSPASAKWKFSLTSSRNLSRFNLHDFFCRNNFALDEFADWVTKMIEREKDKRNDELIAH